MPKGIPNKRYTPEFKKKVIETMQEEKLGYRETAQRFEIRSDRQVRNWERIYLTEGAGRLCGRAAGPREHRTSEKAAERSRGGFACRGSKTSCGE